MRRLLALLAVSLVACLALAACSSSKPAASSSASASASSSASGSASPGANTSVTASGVFGNLPKVSIPKAKAGSALTVKTVIQGNGATYSKSQALAANFVLYFWNGTSSAQKASTFGQSPTLIPSQTLPGLETALQGKKIGSRVLAVIPPAQGYGSQGDSDLGITGSTTLVFVIDLLKAYPNTASATGTQVSSGGGTLPTVTAKAGSAPTLSDFPASPPKSLVVKTLIKGSGPAISKGEYIIAQYTGYIWRTKKTFGSSWSSGSPFGFVLGASPEQVIPGWDKGLVGQTVGSRVMLSIPPADGYGSAGQSDAGIKGTDTLVFVVDIVDALKKG
jgi:FKBP-type peptidyl-prolyl cis-trans isomerase